MSTTESKPADTESQALLPIRSVSQLTGVNPITLRAWERRYGLIRPTRTPAGHRLYSQQDIRTVRRIQELAESGMGFAQIARVLEQENQKPSITPHKPPAPSERSRSLLDRVIHAAIDLDPAGLRAAEATALTWLTPDDYLRDVLIEALAQLEARMSWPDRDLGLTWLAEHVKARADWVADAPGEASAPAVVVDNLVAGRAFSAGGLRLFATLRDDGVHARLLPTGLSETQREQMVRRWQAKAWVRLGPEDSPRSTARSGGARVLWCDLSLHEPRDGNEATDFMQRWRQVIETDIQRCREQVADALAPGGTSHSVTRH